MRPRLSRAQEAHLADDPLREAAERGDVARTAVEPVVFRLDERVLLDDRLLNREPLDRDVDDERPLAFANPGNARSVAMMNSATCFTYFTSHSGIPRAGGYRPSMRLNSRFL